MNNDLISAGQLPAVLGTQICVLHKDDGTIVHMHRLTTFAGAERRSEAEIEREARTLAARHRGRLSEEAHALHLRDFELDPSKTYSVDVRARRLVPGGEVSKLFDRAGSRKL